MSEPFQFYKVYNVYINYKAFLRNERGPVSTNIPILLDATCSGLQHFAGLTSNITLAKQVNVINDTDNISDIYSIAAEYINNKLSHYGITFTRQQMKKPIMTTTYNVTRIGIQEYLLNDVFKQIWENKVPFYIYQDKRFTHKQFIEISNNIHSIIFDLHPYLKDTIKYFEDMIKILNLINLPIIWITPSHMKISQKYIKSEKKKAGNALVKNMKPITVSIPTNIIDSNKQKQSFMPN